jgi:hypothetical protein
MTTSVSSQAISAQESLHRRELENSQAMSTIEHFLTSGQSALDAARQIADIYEPRIKTQDRPDPSFNFDVHLLWSYFYAAARKNDTTAAIKMAELLLALQKQPDVVHEDKTCKLHGNVYWRDLPNFRSHFVYHHEWQFYSLTEDDEDDEDYRQAPQLLNLTIFAATLMAVSGADRSIDLTSAADTAMHEGIDRPYPGSDTICSPAREAFWSGLDPDLIDDHPKPEIREEWRRYVPAAATWILIAGEKIREYCFRNQLPEHANQDEPVVWEKNGDRMWCRASWMSWKQRFEQLAEGTEVDARCRDYAKKAYEVMDKLDCET